MYLAQWRFMDVEPFGQLVWFDPDSEKPILRPLTAAEKADRIDRLSSVSALAEAEDSAAPTNEGGSFEPLLPF